MTDVDDWESDDPFRDADPDPEPRCFTCNDGGYWIDYTKRRPRFGRRRRSRRCRGCNPTRLQHWWQQRRIRYWWIDRKRPARTAGTADDPWTAGEPPF